MLKDDSEIAAKKSLDIMVVLYRKRVWVVSETQNSYVQRSGKGRGQRGGVGRKDCGVGRASGVLR